MRNRTQGAIAFATIVATCTAGMLHASWWAAVVGACVLALISISNHAVAIRSLGYSASAPAIVMVSSVANATVTATAAMGIGHLIGWFWGV